MKKILLCCFFLVTLTLTSTFAQGTWTQKANFPGTARYGAVGFSIGSKGYVGTGYNNGTDYGDFWEYDANSNTWTQKASISVRRAASAFTISGKGYVCLGGYGSSSKLADIWEYTPTTNSWVQKANFPGVSKYGAAGFAIGNKGYIGCGNEGTATGPYSNEFWEFDPSTNAWTKKANFPGSPRYGITHLGWALNGNGYLGLGYNGSFLNDLYEYTPSTNTWTQKANFPGTGRSYGVAFSSCYKYYAGTGQNSGTAMPDIWQYDPTTDSWTQMGNFGGGNRWLMTSCVLNDRGYVGTGYDFTSYYNDWWEYRCVEESVNNQNPSVNYAKIYPTTFSDFATVKVSQNKIHNTELNVYDVTGRLLMNTVIVKEETILQKGNLLQGVYLFEVINESEKVGWGKFIIE